LILALGIDSVEISRFERWTQTCHEKLLRIYSPQELEYCLSNPAKTAERFAVRFAAKEAAYKALSQLIPDTKLPLFTVCKLITVIAHHNKAPQLAIDWDYFKPFSPGLPPSMKAHLSLTHSRTVATAVVILEERGN
jgi:holo-[acyl-carrier protein] synthase